MSLAIALVGMQSDTEVYGPGGREDGLPGGLIKEIEDALGVIELSAQVVVGAGEAEEQDAQGNEDDVPLLHS
jgi:hypothetical protein